MRPFIKFFVFSIIAAMSAMTLASCGGGKTTPAASTSAETSGSATVLETEEKINGSNEKWGSITVFVPDDMNLTGGTIFDKEDKNNLTISAKTGIAYYKISLVTEEQAASDIAVTKNINEEYDPEDIKFTVGSTEWKGVTYTASGTECTQIYGKINNKTVEILFAGNSYFSHRTTLILYSLIVEDEQAESTTPPETHGTEESTAPSDSVQTGTEETKIFDGPDADGRYTFRDISFTIPDGFVQLGQGTGMLIAEDYPTHSDKVSFSYLDSDRTAFTEEKIKKMYETAYEFEDISFENGTKDGTYYIVASFDTEKSGIECSITCYYYFFNDHTVSVKFTDVSDDYTEAFRAMADDFRIIK